MSAFDTLHRFIFANANVRGELVRLDESLNHIVHSYEYPVQIQRLLSEMAAATSLLTATLKFKGEIALQIQSKGPVSYAVINATHDQTLRGVARWDDSLSTLPETFSELLTSAVLVMTITPEEGERYQGVVALEKPTLAECLEAYFTQSEQLATRVHLMTDMQNPERVKAAGVLLQVLPTDASATDVNESTAFSHIATLTETLTEEEMFSLSVEDILYRLYHQEDVELFPAHAVKFACTCSKERSAEALRHVEKSELMSIIEEEGAIKMNCQYCHTEYRFDSIDVESIHSGNITPPEASQ
ncbi:MAG TPA: Hsp33 family molecular chaperone HslO [Alteromonas australica]|jgi:molecular chaperone Hsp33|uniref:Hsp33 family molecular chaperone HslO n=1 Tax=Alteromonas australica TaxID=589873 RepID=A0A075P4B3_9ALTE|nr:MULTISPECIES: Hsp33 family molecular chaperone HslO [Alteromonas]MAB93514.1 Hsp33 family molecular chaperone HslO [Alteromonas sp.]AIG00519.1 molecular chaperone Hsp33 [Alteromonas australica]AJP45397.1 molecular chaperone Hsp33 [Alteromonas australica]MAF69023.1 Hsp33 family molecular chaperone HslO [Alteromonas sp.]MAO29166.1 Hsp33 family molecular chaperone HslO [Alteromonas sp.]|tara:strand:- start:330 stop:1229 length:900 start_codon:yes stop_codon:yes gene_type:complete